MSVSSDCEYKNLNASVLYGSTKLPEKYITLLNSFPHIEIKGVRDEFQNSSVGIKVIDFHNDYSDFEVLNPKERVNIILRMNLTDTGCLNRIINNYYDRFSRLNVIFKDIEIATESTMNDFRLDLKMIKSTLIRTLIVGKELNLSFATDRIVFNSMNNCDAGLKHFTIAPNGKFYICPGFYYSDSEDTIGSLDDGLVIKNQHLLTLGYAPICNICDCYQCKRCVYLNLRTTLEVNTPSHQQCVISHHERNLSGFLLDQLHNSDYFLNYSRIPPVYYLDPFELIG